MASPTTTTPAVPPATGDLQKSPTGSSLAAGKAFPLPADFNEAHYQENVKKVVLIQSLGRRKTIRQHYQLLAKLHRKRTMVAREIWHSETTYLEGLLTMQQLFKKPLTAKAAADATMIVTADQLGTLFSNLDQLIDACKVLMKELQDVVMKWHPSTRIGHIFIKNTEKLKEAYTPYVDNFDQANNLFVKLKLENKKFVDFLATLEFKVCDLGLESYLIMPIQRVARYGLLLRELIKQTWQDHDDYGDLTLALKAVDDVAHHVNEHKTKSINKDKIKLVQSQIMNFPAALGDLAAKQERMYILEGAVTEIGKMPITHFLFLFTDLLLWTQQINKKKFSYKKHTLLSRATAKVGELNSVLIITDEGETKIFTKSKEEQNKWITYIENEDYTPPTEAPQPKRPQGAIFMNRMKMVQSRLELVYKPSNRQSLTPKELAAKKGSLTAAAAAAASASMLSGEVPVPVKKDKSKDKSSSKNKARTIDAKMLEQHKQLKSNPKLMSELKQHTKDMSSTPSERRQTIQLASDATKEKAPKPKDYRMSEQISPSHDSSNGSGSPKLGGGSSSSKRGSLPRSSSKEDALPSTHSSLPRSLSKEDADTGSHRSLPRSSSKDDASTGADSMSKDDSVIKKPKVRGSDKRERSRTLVDGQPVEGGGSSSPSSSSSRHSGTRISKREKMATLNPASTKLRTRAASTSQADHPGSATKPTTDSAATPEAAAPTTPAEAPV